MKLIFTNSPDFNEIDIESTLLKIQKAAQKILALHKPDLLELAKDNEIQINFVTDDQIKTLNAQYRNKDSATDVLSWSFIDQYLKPHELAGEIYISVETAARYAVSHNQTLLYKISFLIVHGLLHVFHYEHDNDQQELQMDTVTNEILNLV